MNDGDPDHDGQSDKPLTIGELVCEMLYGGKTIPEIAGYDDCQLYRVVCRPRDHQGKLVRDNGLPPWVKVDSNGMRIVTNPCSFSEMYFQVQKSRGESQEAAVQKWRDYVAENPRLAHLGDE